MKYVLRYGNGTAWLSQEIVEIEEETSDYGVVLDKAIDQMEERGETGQFIEYEDTVEGGGDIYEDEYVVGGNHGLILLHHGSFEIEPVIEGI